MPKARKPARKGKAKARAARTPVKRKAAPPRRQPKAAGRKPAAGQARAGRGRGRGGRGGPAKRASPAPKGVQVVRPRVARPGEGAAAPPAFEVRLDASRQAQATSPMAAAAREASVKAVGAGAGAGPGAVPKGGMTYASSGVDIQREDKAIEALAGMVSFQRDGLGAPLGRIGHFAGLVDFGPETALVMCTDGVGSKVEVASALRKWDTVGIDCVAMNVNDCICVGAEPLAFVDYLAVQDPDPELTKQVGVGLNEGCRRSNCSLIGGETASLPGIIKGFDLAGTCLGHVRKEEIVDGSKIRPGDVLIGLASTGLHSNGYSLARRAFEAGGHEYTDPWPWPEDRAYVGLTIGEVLLEPTRIYVKEIMSLLKAGIPVHGLAHVTGSGLRKLRRINQGVKYDVSDPLPVHPVFRRIQQLGAVSDEEMYRTFNMGMGFVVVVPAGSARLAFDHLRGLADYEVKVVGKVGKGKGVYHPVGGVH